MAFWRSGHNRWYGHYNGLGPEQVSGIILTLPGENVRGHCNTPTQTVVTSDW
jgi:hypothetical protein